MSRGCIMVVGRVIRGSESVLQLEAALWSKVVF